MSMQIITDPNRFQEQALKLRCQGKVTGLVPTMGYFHEGHLRLMRWARENADTVLVSLFVNPTQFGPGEDLTSYPRDMERDKELAALEGVDILFAPSSEAMYEPGFSTRVQVPALSRTLCGESRPGHFEGVATVVAKLLVLSLPVVAVFGEKDWQQLALIRRMVRDLNLPVAVHGHPIVREEDGLAMSSRNAYLTPDQRAQAPAIHQGLVRTRDIAEQGERDCRALLDFFSSWIKEQLPLGSLEYAAIVHPQTLEPLTELEDEGLLAVAVRLGRARLIDNIVCR
jgi:pantoate--beta-alanine ligase